MKTLEQSTSAELEIEQVRRRIAKADAEIKRITCEILPGMIQKQERRRLDLERLESFSGRSDKQQP